MNDIAQPPALLPSGLFDLIGDDARAETALVQRFLRYFDRCGYLPVQPPLMEFTASLLGGQEDSPLAQQSFRVMDPVSQQTMAIRADMTMQIARIAGGVLAEVPRPLRLCYAGQTLRTLPDTMRASRQFRQIGLELFGAAGPMADAEMMQLAASALREQGAVALTLDISLPPLLPLLLNGVPATEQPALLQAIRHKDIGQIEQLGHATLAELCAVAEGAESALNKLKNIDLPDEAQPLLTEVEQAIAVLGERLGDAAPTMTLDPLEMRGFGYHTGLSFALYAPGCAQELGRGGRYTTPQGEAATGFTLYAEDVLALLDARPAPPLLLLPAHCDEATAGHWRAQGYRTAYALGDELEKEAKEMNINYMLNNELKDIVKV